MKVSFLREEVEHQRSRARMTTEQVLNERLNNEVITATYQYFINASMDTMALLFMGEELLSEAMFCNGHSIDDVREAMR